MSNENAIRITGKLYEARDFTRRMTTPEEYRKRIAEYQGYIRRAMVKWNVSAIEATMKLASKIEMKNWQTPIVQGCLFAAYVEMIEPSKPQACQN